MFILHGINVCGGRLSRLKDLVNSVCVPVRYGQNDEVEDARSQNGRDGRGG